MASSAGKRVFISYSSRDAAAAEAVCAALEDAGVACWIAPRDLTAGGQWGRDIVAAIEGCEAVLVVFSSAANDSPQVAREMEVAVSTRRPLIPVRIENVMPTHDMQYFLGVSHWFNAFPGPLASHLPQMVAAAQQVLGGQARAWSSFTRRLPKARSARVALATAAALVLAVPAFGLLKPRVAAGSDPALGQGGPAPSSAADNASATLLKGAVSERCDAGPSPPAGPARAVDGVYPGMRFSDARKILLCRYPDLSQQASMAQYDISGGQTARLRDMTFSYPPQAGGHRGGEYKLIYDGAEGDGLVLYVSHVHYFDDNAPPSAEALIADFVKRYGASTRNGEVRRSDAESVVYGPGASSPLADPPDVATAGAPSPEQAALINANREYARKLYACRSAVTGQSWRMEDICGLAVGIRVAQGAAGATAATLTAFDMQLTRKQVLGG